MDNCSVASFSRFLFMLSHSPPFFVFENVFYKMIIKANIIAPMISSIVHTKSPIVSKSTSRIPGVYTWLPPEEIKVFVI